jgi:hypothetical protein
MSAVVDQSTLDGRIVTPSGHRAHCRSTRQRDTTSSRRASDYQEAKNMENVPPILPNTATLRVTVVVR